MNTLEAAFVWPIIFAVFSGAVLLGIKTAGVTFKQIRYYESLSDGADTAEIARVVEVVYETIDSI